VGLINSPGLTLTRSNTEAVRHLEQAILAGKHWYLALLEAIRLWTESEETYDGRHYRYLIDGEALDWLLLAERLCGAVGELVPEEERLALLFYGKPPIKLAKEKFKGLIGAAKHRQYLNYFYGVTVEEALFLAVQAEVRKEWRTLGSSEHNLANEAYQRIYGASKATLLRRFRREKGYPQLKSISLTELKEFTYWLFKYRLKNCDKARVASDTKKALGWLNSVAMPS
jgi:PAS domain-containing protein